jgi:hypothetical protein
LVTLDAAKMCHPQTFATAPTSASHPMHPLNLDEGMFVDNSRDGEIEIESESERERESVVKFIVMHTVMGRGPSFTIGHDLGTLEMYEKELGEVRNLFKSAFRCALSNQFSLVDVSRPFIQLPLQQTHQMCFTSRFTHSTSSSF